MIKLHPLGEKTNYCGQHVFRLPAAPSRTGGRRDSNPRILLQGLGMGLSLHTTFLLKATLWSQSWPFCAIFLRCPSDSGIQVETLSYMLQRLRYKSMDACWEKADRTCHLARLSRRWKLGPRAIDCFLQGIFEPSGSLFLLSDSYRESWNFDFPWPRKACGLQRACVCWKNKLHWRALSFDTRKVASPPGPTL